MDVQEISENSFDPIGQGFDLTFFIGIVTRTSRDMGILPTNALVALSHVSCMRRILLCKSIHLEYFISLGSRPWYTSSRRHISFPPE